MARPSEYDPAYCDQVIEYGARGKSLTWMAAELGVCKQTVHNWMKQFPEFLDAMTRAQALAQQWWEDAGQNALLTPGFNSSVWSRSMAARFPDDWREKTSTELTGANGGPVQITASSHDEAL
jgi:hypothetical protein